MFNLAITTYATKSYTYALEAQATHTIKNIHYAKIPPEQVSFVMVGDSSDEVKNTFAFYDRELKAIGIKTALISIPSLTDNANQAHQKQSNIVIAQMQDVAWRYAINQLKATYIWSLESDILPNNNCLRGLLDALSFDNGYYSVASAIYANNLFLGGRGSPHNPIFPNEYEEEKQLSKALQKKLEAKKQEQEKLTINGRRPTPKQLERWRAIDEEVKQSPPLGNVFKLNGEFGWRRRGWFDWAYPAIGKGAIVPVDWVGLGCCVFTREALENASFLGYNGEGTQDLYLCYQGWMDCNKAVVSHCLASHVKKRIPEEEKDKEDKDKKPYFEILHAYHEKGGDYDGHLRLKIEPWHGL